ncbi:methionine--tRNA ligase [Oceanirhabdus sp. W0125-5]|uniref:methionine--tRNA ligase n=1 Tax=Oceanirhabdus sp. W0125-5 TaxID=2999116 RepID=UPI0022F33690|nr:methionine--tRNA ligase [Oceanirhabdus sp. W0125-5]WBW94693.1 methionine--tRNA ligase [Oceanirhabdus sp. W0125-5]
MKVFIGGAWPYANGALHLGHIAALLPGDVLARYHRLKGDDVLYVSGSDCHGSPIALRGKKEKKSPKEIAEKYHREFEKTFHELDFSYDFYGATYYKEHYEEVKRLLVTIKKNGYIYEKESEQFYCKSCDEFLADRFIEGECPFCGLTARGDQCDYCSKLLSPTELINPVCKNCGESPELRKTKHLYFKLSAFQNDIEKLVKENKNLWRENAVNQTLSYLKEGLHDRAVTRDLSWGIDVPFEGYEKKKIYVWIEAVCGYLTSSVKVREDWRDFWEGSEVKKYFVHGKDNIPFHTIIFPSILKGISQEFKLPDSIISSEYLTIEGKKLSTSRNWAIWTKDFLSRYNSDSLRYYLLANGPERRDSDFSWKDFVNRHNGELLGAFGNLVNRTLSYIEKSFDNIIPSGKVNKEIQELTKNVFKSVGEKIENGEYKKSIEEIFSYVRYGNKYFDKETPWITFKEDREKCNNTIHNIVYIIANLSILLEPFLPKSASEIRRELGINNIKWSEVNIEGLSDLKGVKKLFERIDKKAIEEELRRLNGQN